MAQINSPTTTNVFFTEFSLADSLPHPIVYRECYGHLNETTFSLFIALVLQWSPARYG
jgi:hypothetical protein